MSPASSVVLVTGSANVTGLNVVRALVDDPAVTVVGCDVTPWNPANRYCANTVVPRAGEPGYLEAVWDLVDAHRVDSIIVSNDHELRVLAGAADELAARAVALNALGRHVPALLDKQATAELFAARGIPTPTLLTPDSTAYPLVLRKRHAGSGRKFTRVLRGPADRHAMGSPDGDLVATAFVEGPEYTVDILGAEDGTPLAVVPRLRRVVRDGIVHVGEVRRDPVVLEQARAMAAALGLPGMHCAQCIVRDDTCYFFEVNPRPGSGIDLTVAAGVNMPRLWLAGRRGERVTIPEPDWGLVLVRHYDGYFFK